MKIYNLIERLEGDAIIPYLNKHSEIKRLTSQEPESILVLDDKRNINRYADEYFVVYVHDTNTVVTRVCVYARDINQRFNDEIDDNED